MQIAVKSIFHSNSIRGSLSLSLHCNKHFEIDLRIENAAAVSVAVEADVPVIDEKKTKLLSYIIRLQEQEQRSSQSINIVAEA